VRQHLLLQYLPRQHLLRQHLLRQHLLRLARQRFRPLFGICFTDTA
jgi:hypothetical protein